MPDEGKEPKEEPDKIVIERPSDESALSEESVEVMTPIKSMSYGSVEDFEEGMKTFLVGVKGDKMTMACEQPLMVKKIKKPGKVRRSTEIVLTVHEPLKEDPEVREKLAVDIVNEIEDNMKNSLKNALVGAFKEKSVFELTTSIEALKAGAKPEMKRARGCLYVGIGEQEFKI